MKSILYAILKITLCIVIALLLLLALGIYVFLESTDDSVEKKVIFELVTEHQQMLEQDIESGDFSDSLSLAAIKKVREDDSVIEFSCGGSGLGSATYYCGFYYSESDDLNGLWCAAPRESYLKPFEDGFLYEEGNGDNRYYTEHIVGHFYFYEASF